VSVPWYVWLIPGAIIGVPIAESGAEEKISRAIPPLVQAIVDGLDAAIYPFTGLVKHSLKIDRTDLNVAFLETTWCPPPVLTTENVLERRLSGRNAVRKTSPKVAKRITRRGERQQTARGTT
jgi:hypothetical protein